MEKWERRDKKRHKAQYGMQVRNRSIFTIQAITQQKAEEARERRQAEVEAKAKRVAKLKRKREK